MEILFAALGIGCFLVADMAWVLARAAAMGDRMARPPEPDRDWQWPDYRKDAT